MYKDEEARTFRHYTAILGFGTGKFGRKDNLIRVHNK